jgi:acyl carrier protein
MTSIETYMYGLKARAHLHHCLVHGTFSVEMTRLQSLRKIYSDRVRPVTLLPFFIKAVALSVRRTPEVNRILFRRFPFGRRIVRFTDVDVNVPITREIDGAMTTFIGTIRSADQLTVGAIQDALEHMQRGPPSQSPYIEKIRRLKRAPPIVASLFHWLMSRSPAFYLKNAGTCSITTLDGMRGDHFFSLGPTTSLFCIGGIGDEPVVRDGAVVVRRLAKTALALDNYVVSGLDGMALARTFQELCESASFVEEELGTDVVRELTVEIAARARLLPPAVGVDMHLIGELGLSSLDVLSVLAFAEKRFGVLFPDDEVPSLSTVRKIEAAIMARSKGGT